MGSSISQAYLWFYVVLLPMRRFLFFFRKKEQRNIRFRLVLEPDEKTDDSMDGLFIRSPVTSFTGVITICRITEFVDSSLPDTYRYPACLSVFNRPGIVQITPDEVLEPEYYLRQTFAGTLTREGTFKKTAAPE
jgi:hypothetical protein